jgi:hypothetical protein
MATHHEPEPLGDRLPGRLITARSAQRLASRAHHRHARSGSIASLYEGEPFITTSAGWTTAPDVAGSAPDLTSQSAYIRPHRPFKTQATHVALLCEFYVSNMKLEVELWRARHIAHDGADTVYGEGLLDTIVLDQPLVGEVWVEGYFEMVVASTRYVDVDTGELVPLPFEVRYKVSLSQSGNPAILDQGYLTEAWYQPADLPLIY